MLQAEHNNHGQIQLQIKLMKQKDNLINLFSNAIEEQNENINNQHNITFNTDDLKETIDFILELWKQYLLLQNVQNDNSQMNEEYNSINNLENNNGPYSSIILQQDNQQLLVIRNLILQQNQQINSLKEQIFNVNQNDLLVQEDQIRDPNLQQEYENTIKESKKQDSVNVIQELDKRIAWLIDIIKKNSSIVSKKSDHSKGSDEGFNVGQDHLNQENQENNQEFDNMSFASEGTIQKQITLEDLKNVKVLLSKTSQMMKENSEIQRELIERQFEINQLQKKLSEQYGTISNLQKLLQIRKNQERLAQYFLKRKQNQEILETKDEKIFDKIQKGYEDIIKILSVDQQMVVQNPQNDSKLLDIQSIDQISNLSKQILYNAKMLKNQFYTAVIEKEQALDLVQNYKNFILMAILDQDQLPKESIQLNQDDISEIWDRLNIPKKQQQDSELIKILKFQQRSYFWKQMHMSSEQFWNSWNERFQNQIVQINLSLKTLLSMQQESFEQMSSRRKIKQSKIVLKQQQNRLQFIENEIEKKNLVQVKQNIQIFIGKLS